jgi:hypothetical protein
MVNKSAEVPEKERESNMATKKVKKSKAKAATAPAPAQSKREYLPRQGTLPGRIFGWLNDRPMGFAELSANAQREMGLVGDKLASQLSAALHDLCQRGVVVRIDPATRRVVPSKNARGAFYGLETKTRSSFRAALNGHGGAAAPMPPGASDSGPRRPRPASMPQAAYDALMAQRSAAEKTIAAIDNLFANIG